MSGNNTHFADQEGAPKGPPPTVIWRGRHQWLSLIEKADGSLVLMLASDVDSSGARNCPVPAEALGALSAHLWGLSWSRAMAEMALSLKREIETLQLNAGDRAATMENAGPMMRLCPICLKANPCARHSLAQQLRGLRDPEYLESVVPPTDLTGSPRSPRPAIVAERHYGSGADEFPGCDLGRGLEP